MEKSDYNQWPAVNTMQNTQAKDSEGEKVGEKTTKGRSSMNTSEAKED